MLGALALGWHAGAEAQCPGAGTPGALGGSEYLYCDIDAGWAAADADCATAAAGWSLTRVDDSVENAFIRGLGDGNLWIGGDDQAVDGEWRWRDGDQFWQGDDEGTPVGGLYNNWNGGQPNAGADEDCTRMKGDSTWEDRKCDDTERYVCEGPPICGSGARGAGEECDDGNTDDGDGCSSTCILEGPAPCGDGLIWLGEECDDGDTEGGDGCSATCAIEPGFECTGEPSVCTPACAPTELEWHSRMGSTTTEYLLCDTSHQVSDALTICEGLASGWTLARVDDASENGFIDGLIGNHLWLGGNDEAVEGEWRWRDGDQFWQGDEFGTPVGGLYTNWKSGEPGNGLTENCLRQENGGLWQDRKCTDTEKFICEGPPICGNGVTTTPEECDDANTADGDGCSATCTLEGAPTCGDGLIWLGEGCDDGDALGGDGCSSTCQVEPGYTCTGQPSTCTADCENNFEWHSQMGSTTTEYFLCEKAQPASSAEALCEGLGAGWTLARIDDATENGYIDGFIGNELWVGGHDEAVEGEWRWRDGAQFWQGDEFGTPVGGLYTNWDPGQEPDGGIDEGCLRQDDGGLWQDRKCTDNEKLMCEGPPICGNGAVAMPEQCDDANTADGDGCSSSCTVESGYECFLPDDLGTPSICQLSADVVVGSVELLEVRGRGVLQWKTMSQSGTLGFVVSRLVGDVWQPLHEGALLALPGAPQGGVYRLRDSSASIRRPESYRIEEIEIDGARKPIGEWRLQARPASEPILLESGYEALPHELVPLPVDVHASVALKSGAASEPASRIVLEVAQDGPVGVSVATLAELLAKSASEVRSWLLDGNVRITDRGYQVPWWFDEARDSLVFAGRSSTSIYSAVRPYVVRNAPGHPMPIELHDASESEVGVGGTRHFLDSNAFPALAISPDPESDYWFAASLSARALGYAQYETGIELPDGTFSSAVLRAHLYGGWNLTEASAQRVDVHVNGALIDTVEIAANGPHVFEMTVDPTLLRGGNNELLLVADSDVPAAVSGLYVDRFELEVDRVLSTPEAELGFIARSNATLTVELAASSAHLLDITDPKKIEATLETDIELGVTSVTFEAEQDHSYLVFEAPNAPTAIRAAVELEEPTGGASYLVIAPAAWADVASQFAAFHAAEGLSSAIVSVESIYDAYGHSIGTPHAIHDFLVDAAMNWVEKPRYVLLLGDGTFDYRSHMGIGPGAIAPRMAQTTGGLYASDALLGDLDDDGLADVAIGRIPAQTFEEAIAAFQALQAYESLEPDDFGLAALMISGVNRGADFTSGMEELAGMFPPTLETRWISVDALGIDEARAELALDVQRAPLWMHYLGHGGLDRFDDGGVLTSEDASTLQPPFPPIVTGMTCTTSRFELPGIDSLAEHIVDPGHGFAIASWGPSGLTMSHDATKLGEAFARRLFSSDDSTPRLGDVIVALHHETVPEYDPRVLAVYVLLGDPALRLKSDPENGVVAPSPDPAPPSGSTTDASVSVAGCAVRSGHHRPLPIWLVAFVWLVLRRRSR